MLPGVHAILESFVTHREILCTVIERSAVVATARGHVPTHTAAFFKHGHRKTVVGQSAITVVRPEMPAPTTATVDCDRFVGPLVCMTIVQT